MSNSLTHDEIIKWFRRFRSDPMFRDENGSRTVPIRNLCDFAGIRRQNVYLICNKEIRLTENYRRRLSYAIECVEQGLRWQRRRKVYTIVGKFEKMPRYAWPERQHGHP